MAKFDEKGRQVPDRTPVAIPARRRIDTQSLDEMRRLIREEMSREAMDRGAESFEEANDFDVGDDEPLPVSRHRFTEMQEEHLRTTLDEVKQSKRSKDERSVQGIRGVPAGESVDVDRAGAGGVDAQKKGQDEPTPEVKPKPAVG